MHRRAPFASFVATYVSAVLAVTSVGACYDWAPPVSTQGSENGGGAAPPGGEAESASSSATSAASSGAGPDGSGGAPSSSASSSSSSGAVTVTVGVGGGGPGGEVCDDGGLCTSCIACALHGACEALAEACSADETCASFADCISYCIDEICLDDCVDAEPQGADQFQEAAECAVCQECPQDCAGIADWVPCP
jgi:hypothetical protein